MCANFTRGDFIMQSFKKMGISLLTCTMLASISATVASANTTTPTGDNDTHITASYQTKDKIHKATDLRNLDTSIDFIDMNFVSTTASFDDYLSAPIAADHTLDGKLATSTNAMAQSMLNQDLTKDTHIKQLMLKVMRYVPLP